MKASYVIALSLLITVAASGIAYYFYNRYQHTQVLLRNPQEAAKAETKTIVDDVARYMELPTNEQPTLATVTDVKKLQDQPFFKRAQNGDKVLIYIQAKEAILFRPNNKKIIAVAPISLNDNQNQGNVAGASTEVSPTIGAPITPTLFTTPRPISPRPTIPTSTPAPAVSIIP